MNFSFASILLLPLLSSCMKLDVLQTTANFDDIPNGFSIASPYKNLNWNAFLVSSPDRGQPSYVKYDSQFQYARVYNETLASIDPSSSSSGFLITSLKYACSKPTDNLTNPGTPLACTIKIKENCAQSSKSRTLTVTYNPTTPIAPMNALNLAGGQKCKKAKSYSFQSNGPDILLDGVKLKEFLQSTV